jgi:formylglycine-generating enzyme required for sulfatase activity
MAGNLFEWCQDWFGVFPGGSVINPQGAVTGYTRVLRGGTWYASAAQCRSAQRGSRDPTYSGNSTVGFRVVLAPQ